MQDLQDQAIRQHCKALCMPRIGGQFGRLAEPATWEGQSYGGYLEARLATEMEKGESWAVTGLLHEANLLRMKTLYEFEFDRSSVSAAQLHTLAEGDYVAKANRSCWSASLVPEKPIWQRGCAWTRVACGGECDSPGRRR